MRSGEGNRPAANCASDGADTSDWFEGALRMAVTEQKHVFLIVGLGNPGGAYAGNRHNVGYAVAMEFSARHAIPVRRKGKVRSRIGVGEVANKKVIVALPTTFMNRSGEAVARLVAFYGVHPKNVLVVSDDINLPLGRLRIRSKGSDGGHKGLRSVIAHLGTTEFPRLRLGIGVEQAESVTDFVLGDFTKEETAVIRKSVGRAAEAVETVVREGADRAMSEYNRVAESE